MISLNIHFPAHRYHATPWGNHVNEAQVAWPPDPWRILRALTATWRRKLDPAGDQYREETEDLLTTLASVLPHYHLPPTIAVHTRHYMPVRSGTKEKPVLIFDTALHIAKGVPLTVTWPVELTDRQRALLTHITENLGYLGRAESWVEITVEDHIDKTQPDCFPIDDGQALIDPDTGELLGEHVQFLVPRTPEEYRQFRQRAVESMPTMKRKEKERFMKTLPENWLDALCADTSDLRAVGWSAPPAAKTVYYRRPVQALDSARREILHLSPSRREQPTTLRYALAARPLPAIEQAVRVGEWARLAAMGRAKHLLGEKRIPWQISGHGTPEGNRHQHAFFLPEDADEDGRIDHLLIHVPAGLDAQTERVLRTLRYLKDRDGNRIQLLFEGLGGSGVLVGATRLVGTARDWTSITPYLFPWHLKLKKSLVSQERADEAWRQIEAQIRRECRERGLPEPAVVEEVGEIRVAGRPRSPIHFHRYRSKRGLVQPDRLGRFLRIRFPEPVSGPLALGFGCHFGLGLFRPQ